MVTKWSDFSRNIHTTTTFFGWGDWFLETNYRSSFLQVALAFQLIISWWCFTPLKINMEPKNHPIEEENHLPNLHFGVPCWFSGGVSLLLFHWFFPHPFATSWCNPQVVGGSTVHSNLEVKKPLWSSGAKRVIPKNGSRRWERLLRGEKAVGVGFLLDLIYNLCICRYIYIYGFCWCLATNSSKIWVLNFVEWQAFMSNRPSSRYTYGTLPKTNIAS